MKRLLFHLIFAGAVFLGAGSAQAYRNPFDCLMAKCVEDGSVLDGMRTVRADATKTVWIGFCESSRAVECTKTAGRKEWL